MENILENFKKNRDMILTKVSYSANDYENYPEEAELKCVDEVKIKSINKDFILFSIDRIVQSSEQNIFSFLVSYEIKMFFETAYTDNNYISEESLLNLILSNQDFFFNGCLAKISLIISEISSKIANGIPIITPPQLVQ